MTGAFYNLINFVTLLQMSGYQQHYSSTTCGNDFYDTATIGQWQVTSMGRIFFSAVNLDAIQAGIRGRVASQTGTDVGRQSDNELRNIMRWFYKEYGAVFEAPREELITEVKRLNKMIIDKAASQVVTSMIAHNRFVQDIASGPRVLPEPQNTSVRGTKVLQESGIL